jgi:hypothetical protein
VPKKEHGLVATALSGCPALDRNSRGQRVERGDGIVGYIEVLEAWKSVDESGDVRQSIAVHG